VFARTRDIDPFKFFAKPTLNACAALGENPWAIVNTVPRTSKRVFAADSPYATSQVREGDNAGLTKCRVCYDKRPSKSTFTPNAMGRRQRKFFRLSTVTAGQEPGLPNGMAVGAGDP